MPTLLDRGNLKQPDLPNEIPIDYIVGRVREQIQQPPNQTNPFANRLLILEAGTATGKSITVAPELYIMTQALEGYARKTVICTQPRILTAQEIPAELDGAPYFARHGGFKFKLGENLGTQSSASVDKGENGLLFATLGVLEMQLTLFNAQKLINKYSIIVIDEAHERQLIFDSTIALVKKFFIDNRESQRLPYLVLMSATFDALKYAKFFNVGDENICRVEGFSFPIEERWPATSVPIALDGAYDAVVKCIHEEVAHVKPTMTGDVVSDNRILLFVTGAAEGKAIKTRMQKEGWPAGKTVDGVLVKVDSLYVDGPSVKKVTADYLKLTGGGGDDNTPTLRMDLMVVNAVAETGLSLSDLKYVIDCGWSKESEFNPTYNITSMLVSKPAAQSRIRQRRGRVGRKKPGVFIPLYTKDTYDALEKNQMPEILKLDPTGLVLSVIIMNGVFDARIGEFLMDVPSKTALKFALDKLQMLGYIDHELKPTPFASIASKIIGTVGVEGATMIMSGLVYGASIDDLVVISTMMKYAASATSYTGYTETRKEQLIKEKNKYESGRRVRKPAEYEQLWQTVVPMPTKDGFYKLRALFADEFIEALVIFRAFEATFDKIDPTATSTKKYTTLDKWCSRVFLVTDQMLEIYHDYVEVKSKLCMAGVNITQNSDKRFVDQFKFVDIFAEDTMNISAMMDPIVRLKLCIKAGYKFNTATYDSDTGGYRINYGGLVTPISNFFGNDPQASVDWSRFGVAENYAPEKIVFYKSDVMYKANDKKYTLALHGTSVNEC